ncbi:MAG: LemA family protein [Oceanidesulfovibrio sp.]
MDGPTLALSLLAASLTALVLYAAYVYNKLVGLSLLVKNALSQIDVQLSRRHNLIPNLVAVTQGYLAHERGVLESVTRARAEASRLLASRPEYDDAVGVTALSSAETELTASLARLLVVMEAYPELKGAQHTGRLMEELASAENRVAFARQHYNDSAMRYNTLRESFPAMFVAGAFGFTGAAYLEFADRSIEIPFDVGLNE